jgi:hypothetical protein
VLSAPALEPPPPFLLGGREDRSGVDFDERAWPCVPVHRGRHEAACRRGRERMRGARVVLCGLARDVEAVLPLNLARLARLGSLFADHRIVVYENDSRDGTARALSEAARRDGRLRAICETLGAPRWAAVRDPRRAADMARCRNRLHAAVTAELPDFDHVIVADLDLEGWSYEGVASSFGHDGWDAMASMGIRFSGNRPFFYDTWALRAVDHPEPHGRYEARAMVFPRGTEPVPVRSAFSGLAVYSMAAFRAGRYAGGDCEHVTFHASLAASGFGRIRLNPSMISLYPDFAGDEL